MQSIDIEVRDFLLLDFIFLTLITYDENLGCSDVNKITYLFYLLCVSFRKILPIWSVTI